MIRSAEAATTRRDWLALGVMALASVVVGMDMTVLNLAVPALSRDLAPSSAQLLWIVDIYGFLSAGSLLAMGVIGDRIGRRRLLLAGGAAFAAASVFAAFAPTAEMLIIARGLLGVAGATLMPSALSLAADLFRDPSQRTLALGTLIASVSVGTAVGPLAGGAALEYAWWGSVFLLAVPPMVVLLLAGPKLLPAHQPGASGPLDLPSAAQSLGAVLLLVYGLKRLPAEGLDAGAALAMAAGVAAAAWFVTRQRNLAEPFLDVRLFATVRVTAALLTLLAGIFVLHAAYLFVAQYHQLVAGLSPFEAGLWSAPAAGGVIVGSTLGPRLDRWLHPAVVVAGASLLTAAAFAALSRTTPGSGPAFPAVCSVVISLGLGPLMTMTTSLVLAAAPRRRAGSAASLSETSGVLGGALGVALLGSIGTAVYRAGVDGPAIAGLPAGVQDAARETLGGAVATAEGLPSATADGLLEEARSAFVESLSVAAGLSAALMAAVAVAAIALLRRLPAGGANHG